MKGRRLLVAIRTFALFLGSSALIISSLPGLVLADGYGGGHHGKESYEKGHDGMGMPGKGAGHYGKGMTGHGSAHSGMGHSGMGKHHGLHQDAHRFIDHILKFKDGLGITEEQEKQLRAVETAYKKTQIQLKAKVELANLDLHELLRNEHSDLSAIQEKLNAVMTAEGHLIMASIKAKREAKSILTDEQRKRMKAIHDRIKSYGRKGMKSGHPGGYPHHSKEQPKSHP